MEARLIAEVLLERRRLRSHERWSPDQLQAHRSRRLAELRRHAYRLSPFYRRFHRGLEDRPLEELPVLTKAELMASFDELVTVPDVRLAEVQRYLEVLDSNE